MNRNTCSPFHAVVRHWFGPVDRDGVGPVQAKPEVDDVVVEAVRVDGIVPAEVRAQLLDFA